MAFKIDKMQLVPVVSEFNENGELVMEHKADPIVVFRAVHKDVWSFLDEQLKKVENGRN